MEIQKPEIERVLQLREEQNMILAAREQLLDLERVGAEMGLTLPLNS
jgi:hypothetical protein